MYPIVGFGGELLGEIRLKFQLLMATNLVDTKGGVVREVKVVVARNAASSGPEEVRSSLPPGLVVQPKVSLARVQRATGSKSPSPMAIGEEEEFGTPPTVRWNILKSGRSMTSPAPPTYSVTGGLRNKMEEDPGLGREQLAVVEELIARGTTLHSNMVQSLLRDSLPDEQCQEGADSHR